MTIHEYGKGNTESMVLIHPSLVTWEYFEKVIPVLEKDYHLFIPAIPGYDLSNDSQFISVEITAGEIADQILDTGIRKVKAIYGCSMGGSIALRIAADHRLRADNYIMDGGITPYQLPWILTRFIAFRDFCMNSLGKLGGEKLLVRAFSSSEYSEEDMKYIADVLKHCTYKTLWNTFDSCNNYKMPRKKMHFKGSVRYWYGEKEKKARDWDLKYMSRFIPGTLYKEFKDMDHGDLAWLHPEMLAKEISEM